MASTTGTSYAACVLFAVSLFFTFANARQVEYTCALIKPEALSHGKADNIIADIKAAGYKIERQREVHMDDKMAEDFYSDHAKKEHYDGTMEYMTSGPCIAMILSKRNAIKAWRMLIGPTNPEIARTIKPKSLRARYGNDKMLNAVHGSDNYADARREIGILFPDFELPNQEEEASEL